VNVSSGVDGLPINSVGKNESYFKREQMFTIALFFGFGFGLEGIEDGKVYVGIYTPTVEYGYVITSEQVYLDTILEKNQKKSS
jgi:hypothetical protein